jgi:hypothetical protein
MRYVIIAILLYFVYLFIKRVLKNVINAQNKKAENKENNTQKRIYDSNMIQDAEFREVKKD